MRRQSTVDRGVRTLKEFVDDAGRYVRRGVVEAERIGKKVYRHAEKGVRSLRDLAGHAAQGHRNTWKMLDDLHVMRQDQQVRKK